MLRDAALGMACFREERIDGHIITHIDLDASAFTPGAVLVLRAWQPRNVALRSAPLAVAADKALSAASISIVSPPPPSAASSISPRFAGSLSTNMLVRATSGAFTSGNDLLARLGGGREVRTPTDSPPHAATATPLLPRISMRRTPSLGGFGGTAAGPTTVDLRREMASVGLLELQILLYRSEGEERDASGGARGVFSVPGMGPLPWAGLAGSASALRHCRRWNDMGHALLENLRQGPWLLEYLLARLDGLPRLAGVRSWLAAHAAILRGMPPGLRPQGFDRVVSTAMHVAVDTALALMPGRLLQRLGVGGRGGASFAVAPRRRDGSPREAVYFCGDVGDPEGEGGEEIDVYGDGEEVDDESHDNTSFSRALLPAEGQADPASAPPLITALALTSVMLFGVSRSAPLLYPALLTEDPGPGGVPGGGDGSSGDGNGNGNGAAPAALVSPTTVTLFGYAPSLAAGVDHFCTGFMRSWGRDTCISLRGLLLVTGRFAEARAVLLSLASVVRHGLLPNLVDSGRGPRYNCRDAAWWFLQALQDYTRLAPEGAAVLATRVRRRWPSDERQHYLGSPGAAPGGYCGPAGIPLSVPLSDVVQGILAAHAQGIDFEEWGAGPGIDEHMAAAGFRVTARLDAVTGVVSGGSAFNCGTWMDKMGSATGLNKGEPATPRDGAAVEITGLVYSTVAWLAALHTQSPTVFPYSGVALPPPPLTSPASPAGPPRLSYADWTLRLKNNFERLFYVPTSPAHDSAHALHTPWVNARGMYKDTSGSSAGWADYQLRPNYLVAMAVAPALFTPAHAQAALTSAERSLVSIGSLGVKTLDPADWAFRGNYDNNAEGDKATAKGWNYHQGPEWLWPYGYYLRARLHFPARGAWASFDEARRWLHARLARHRAHVESSPEGGLPELTQAGGAHCPASCVVQAWSSGTILDALHDLHVEFGAPQQA